MSEPHNEATRRAYAPPTLTMHGGVDALTKAPGGIPGPPSWAGNSSLDEKEFKENPGKKLGHYK